MFSPYFASSQTFGHLLTSCSQIAAQGSTRQPTGQHGEYEKKEKRKTTASLQAKKSFETRSLLLMETDPHTKRTSEKKKEKVVNHYCMF